MVDCYGFGGHGSQDANRAIAPHPIPPKIFVDDSVLPQENAIAGLSTIGFGIDGQTELPEPFPEPEACGGAWYGPSFVSDPNPRSRPPPPPGGGETIDTAVSFPSLPYYDSGMTCGNTNDYDEVGPCSGSTSPVGVYRYGSRFNGMLMIDLCAFRYDTKVCVYRNSPGDLIACNDDAGCGAGGLDIRTAEFELQAIIYGLECDNPEYVLTTAGHCQPGSLCWTATAGQELWLWVGPSGFSCVPESDHAFEVCGIQGGATPVIETTWGAEKMRFTSGSPQREEAERPAAAPVRTGQSPAPIGRSEEDRHPARWGGEAPGEVTHAGSARLSRLPADPIPVRAVGRARGRSARGG